MALTPLQRAVMQRLAKNRSASSYVAGGAALNRDWPRLSEDLDIFHDTDEEIGASADRDIATLEDGGFSVSIDVRIYGCVEATVRRTQMDATVVQWMSETRTRYFPLVRDEEWGARLHAVDLAINKVLAASSRRKARDHYDLVSIAERLCGLGPLVMAAAGKPPHFSPKKIIDNLRRNGLSIADEEFKALRVISELDSPAKIRGALDVALMKAEAYIESAPTEAVGVLVLDVNDVPTEMNDGNADVVTLRRATDEHETLPQLVDVALDFRL